MLRNVPTLYNRIYDWEPFVCNSIWLFIGTGECDGNSAVIKIIGTRDRAPASHFCYPPDNKRFHPSTRIEPPLVPPFFFPRETSSPESLFDPSSDRSRDLGNSSKRSKFYYKFYKCFCWDIRWIVAVEKSGGIFRKIFSLIGWMEFWILGRLKYFKLRLFLQVPSE